MQDSNQEFIQKFKFISDVLLDYGWFASPYMMGYDFNRLHEFCQEIKKFNGVIDAKRKQVIQERVNDYLLEVMFDPNYRAFYVMRSKELPHISEFSHLLERAMFHYYKQDYLSAILCMLPAVEGSLLSFYGWKYGESRKPTQRDLITKISEAVDSRFPERYEMYSSTLRKFLDKWILADTKQADFDISFLNRHYILHGMGHGNFYSASDCHRLILFFDLFIELLSIKFEQYYGLIPEDNFSLNVRREYYNSLIKGNIGQKEMLRFEETFMLEHKNYHPEENPPNWANVEFQYMLKMMDIFDKANRERSS